jgi:RNA polymerase sigma-70 factor (ECF subfamily)
MILRESGGQVAEARSGQSGLPISEAAFAEAVEPHLRRLVSTATSILRCEHHAWDAIQETLLALWQEPELPHNLPAWLLRTVTYRSLQLQRSCTRRRQREAVVACCRPECRCGEDPSSVLARREVRSLFDDACASLPAELREVLVLREVEQLDYKAIALRMDIPMGTVRSRLSRCRIALREFLAQSS